MARLDRDTAAFLTAFVDGSRCNHPDARTRGNKHRACESASHGESRPERFSLKPGCQEPLHIKTLSFIQFTVYLADLAMSSCSFAIS
jgi:hypothetical protein